MKVILTEQQINNIVLIEEIKITLYESLNENISIENFKKNIKKMLLTGVALTSIIAAINGINISQERKAELKQIAKQEQLMIQQQNERDSIKNIKIEACKKYMLYALKNQGFSGKSTQLSPEALVEASEKYSFDLPFLMAAAHLESCFGATNRAKKTNSVYSVGAYDNGKNIITYAHPNDSIEGYIRLLKNDYLINGKTIEDLLKPGCFVNKNGHRYASKKNYETLLKSVRNRIIKKFPELA